ncbi:31497_t:CDS:10 [Racocetra persica]|uniref:31497_t:CDS:1 n=1 Tax=Racocetra persica TaxID=160502 RepID=A0ACA9ME18_9GLOM|nr:31497_t:CDS:10 [Racocetra persica]
MSTNQHDNDVILAQLLSFGFDESICQRAITCNKTVEEATEWILNTLDENSGSRTSSNNTLVLRPPESYERASAPMMIDAEQSASSSSTSNPTIISRYSTPENESEYTEKSKAKAAKVAEELKRSKLLEKEARKKTLLAIKEDRENLKLRRLNPKTDGGSPASSSSISTPPQKIEQSDSTLIQIRLSTGQAIRQNFLNTALVSDLFSWVISKNEPSKKFQLVIPFPRKVFGDDEMGSTLTDAGLVPNASLNVVKLDMPSIATQAPINSIPSSITSNIGSDDSNNNGSSGSNTGQLLPNVPNPFAGQQIPPPNLPQQLPPPNLPQQLPPPVPMQQGLPPNLPQQLPPPIPVQPGILHPLMNVQPGIPPRIPGRLPQNPIPPLLHHPMHARSLPFSGTSFRLNSNQPSQQPILQQDSDDDSDDEEKRKRIAEAVQARVRAEDSASTDDSQHTKHGIRREVGSLKSKCAYFLLTTTTSMKTLRFLSRLSSDICELLVDELIKLDNNLQNIILDNYKTTDSLLEVISNTQSSSVTKVSLRNCDLITDNGFNCLQELHYLEYLDVMSCRIRDRTLPFLKDFGELRALNLSKTKVTMNGLRILFASCAFASTLEDLNLSYCPGVGGKTVFADLQPLQNLRRLNLDSVQLTPPLVPVKPSSFKNLEMLDLSRTRLCDQDVMKIICQFKNMVELVLIETIGIGQFGLKWMAKEFKSLNFINFPNREEELDDILQDFSELPLVKMDLTGFINVSDAGIMYLAEAKSLTFLSLSGTKLTDAGMVALKDLVNLVELYLDRTLITDAGVAYLDGLRELTHLSLNKTRIKNASLSIIRKSTFATRKLKYLNVGHTRVTDKGVKELKGLPHLSFLNLDFTKVSLSCRNILADIPSLQPVRLNGITKETCDDEYYDI